MKRISFPLIFVVIMVLGLFSLGFSERGIQIQIEKTRFALVIGNGSYKSSPLRNPTNDAHDMALVLKTLGFEVTHLENAEYSAMERAVRKFGKQLRNGGAGLFYFAGHGVQVNGRNYLIPVDAEIETESDVKFETLDAARVLGKMEDAGNDLNIVILDACRDNPFSRSFRASNQGLARMDAPRGSLIAYATAPGSTAADGEGRNGIYTKYLIKYIMIPDLTVEQVLKKVRVEVLKETNNRQIPWESSSLTGIFRFNPVKSEMIPSKMQSQQAPLITRREGLGEKYETLFWDSIKASNDAEAFKVYLKKFPNGVFAELARLYIKKYSQQIEEKSADKSNFEDLKIKKNKPKLADIPKTATIPIEEKPADKSHVEGLKIKKDKPKSADIPKTAIIPIEEKPADKSPVEGLKIKQDKPKLASIPKTVTIPKISLRTTPRSIENEKRIRKMLRSYGFFDKKLNPLGSVNNDFIDHNDGTITDKLTGLMWQKAGSSVVLPNRAAKSYIRRLNKDKFAGYSDWRLPTIEELASLLKKKNSGNLYVDPIFDKKNSRCWSVDETEVDSFTQQTWVADFGFGKIKKATWISTRISSFHTRYVSLSENYVRAVRTVK